MTRRGFTLIEMFTALSIFGILLNIALPAGTEIKRRADAAHVVADFHTIRAAAFDQFAETGTFPKSGKWGRVPKELVAALPQGFAFSYKTLTYRWRRWSLPNGLPRKRRQTVLLGLQIRSSDRALIRAIKNLYQGDLAFGKAKQVTLVIE